jgi:hypothetical protein
MSNLRAVLANYSAVSPRLGPETARTLDPQAELLKTKNLISGLQAVSKNNRGYFLICVAMIAVLFIGACWISLTHLDNPSFIRGIFTVTGISFLGLVSQMARLWKTKVLSDMTLVLAGNLAPADLKQIVELLLSSLK